MSAASFTARLDAVPLNRFHWKLLIASGLGWMFDAMDVILISFLLAPIGKEFALDAPQRGLVVSAGFVGMFVGAATSGRLADRYGRKTIFQITLLVFSLGSVLSALAPSYETLLVARIVTGLGLGGELPVVSTLMSEFAPRARRGRMVSLLESFWAYGTIAAGLIGVFVLPSFGWRGAFLVGAVPALYVAYLRRALPESPRYLASRGLLNEADAVVRRLMTADGVGPLVASAYRVVIEDAKRFRSGREVAAYVGLTPSVHSSGSRERLGRISKRGDKMLRTLLIEGALVVLNRCRQHSELQDWGRKLRQRVGQKKAAVAVARKLCAVLWAMWKKEADFKRT